jgi:aminoglycoside N3'-acetyltransferase
MENNASNPRVLSKKEMVDDLRGMGLKAGDGLMVHSSIKALGRTENGTVGIIEALQEVLTEEGTLMMPSFNHGNPWKARGKGFYNPKTTPCWNGAIPDAFWRLPNVFRSLDPTHPIAAWGKNAKRYTEFHHRTLTMGPDSPLGMLGKEGGYAMMLGVGYAPNTYHHVVEMTLGSPCVGQRNEQYPIHLPDGRIVMGRTWGWRSKGCPITDPTRYVKNLQNFHRVGKVGTCETILFKLADAYNVIASALIQGMDGFPPCSQCPIRPRVCDHNVESDWDNEKHCLKADSIGWTY